MRQMLLAMVLVIIVTPLVGCETNGVSMTASADKGKPLGDTGVRVSGSVDVGGSAVAR